MSLSAGSRKRRRLRSWRYPSRPWWKGEVEVVREGRRVYVRMHGPEYLSDEELLRRAIAREDELQQTVRELDGRASELERERDEARDAAIASGRAYEEMEEAYWKERAAHEKTKEGLIAARVTASCCWRCLSPASSCGGSL